MTQRLAIAFGINAILLPLVVAGQALGEPAAEVRAFPTAEGFGTSTVGGRGGRVIAVTNLNDAGPGSLRQAMEAETGPRVVVFRTGGTIALRGPITVREPNSFLTVAGQTAPGGGIQLKNHGIDLRDGARDVVIRHLRIRPGIDGVTPENQGDIDAVTLWGNRGTRVRNVVIDHCSLAWAVDENANAWGEVTDTTFQWCIIAEGATEGHHKGPHSMGMLVSGGDRGERITLSVHHCLFAHNAGRNPLVARADVVDFRNNVVYNWSGNNFAAFGEWTLDHSARVNFVNNHYLKGPQSTGGGDNVAWLAGSGTKVYTEGNWGPAIPEGSADGWAIGFLDIEKNYRVRVNTPASAAQFRSHTPFPAPAVTTRPTGELLDALLADVGASRALRDAVDRRIVEEVRQRSGQVGIGSDYPRLAAGTPPVDTDGDGIPDEWEQARGLDPHDPADGAVISSNGYTHLENYLNELAGDPIPGNPYGPHRQEEE